MLGNLEAINETHIVLVEPQDSLNVGSIARAMMNFGFQHLHLVQPGDFSIEKAMVTGRWAEDILRGAVVHNSLASALDGMQDVVGFSSHHRPRRGEPTPLPDWLRTINVSTNDKRALLLGREDTGLTVEAIEQCRLLIRIPTRAEYPALNLAQSALIVLYEMSRLAWDTIERPHSELPSWNHYSQLDRLCSEVMNLSGFHRGEAGEPTANSVKNMLRRIQMNEKEMRIMLALFNRVHLSLTRRNDT